MTTTDTIPEEWFKEVECEWGPMFIRTELTCKLDGGLIGYFMTPGRPACLAACLATILQRPLEEIPESVTDAGSLLVWADSQGLEVDWLNPRTDPQPIGLAVGVTPVCANGVIPNARHTIVLRDGRVFFDPAMSFRWPPDLLPPAPVREIDHAFTLKKEES